HVFSMDEKTLNMHVDELSCTLGEELLRPTRIYVSALNKLTKSVKIKGISNITGGGFYENIPRMLPSGVCARVEKASYTVPPIFNIIEKTGKIPNRDMYNTFNMGISLVIAVDKNDADAALASLRESGERAYIIGETAAGESGVELW
ncbi:MAG: AIR synthase-related protein, partial [Clostridia bacterium]